MGLYKLFEKSMNNITLKNYESIIKSINEYYNEFSKIYKEEIFLDVQIDSCIRRGNKAFEEYLSAYLDFFQEDDEFLKLKDILNNYSKQQPNIDRCYKLIDGLIQTSSLQDKERILRKDWTSKLDYLLSVTINNESSYNNAYLFMIGSFFIKEYKDIFIKIRPLIDRKVQNGQSFISSIKEVIDSQNIVIDDNKILSTFSNARKRQLECRNKLREVYKDKYIKNFFISETNKLRNKVETDLAKGKSKEQILQDILSVAYGLVKAACEYCKGIVAYDVQLMGAIAINEGKVAEMYTGEGKTLTAIFAAYLNSLIGQEVHIFTPNDYLSSRDARDNKDIYNLLGLTVGFTLIDGQTIDEKKEAYKCDVVYGSSTAFAFDFLKDTNADYLNIVRSGEKPGFVIVDEADQILINNALNPYQLTGGRALTKQDMAENRQAKYYINLALEIERMLSRSAYVAKSQYEYECITGDNKEYTLKMNDKYSLLVGVDEVYLTSKGEKELFYYFMYDKAIGLVEQASSYFKNNSEYVLGKDYLIKEDKIILTVDGFDRACKEIDEFSKLNMEWLTEEEALVIRKYLNNALVAKYIMKKGKHYQLGIDPKTSRECIFVLQDGRIMPDSKFAEGLHQALEVKEGIEIQISNGERLIDSIIATISNRALLSRYDKVSGMTGTADYDAFREIYGLDTFKVPRNIQYLYDKGVISNPPLMRKDRPVILCQSEEIKMECIIKETVNSYLKSQPVLIVSDDDEIVKRVFERIIKTNPTLSVQLLISNKNLQEEAEIISRAGLMGTITVASEMAGRGTDIKLGGETYINIEAIINEIIFEKASQFFKKSGIKKEQDIFNRVFEALKLEYECYDYYKQEIDSIAEKRLEQIKEEVYKTGGLKYVQVNPFRTSRNDNQGRGRVGRGGEPGETVMYVTLDDLAKMGTDKSMLQALSTLLETRDIVDDVSARGLISECIDIVQQNNEYIDNIKIASTDTMDFAMSSIGFRILKQRSEFILNDDITNRLENSIQILVQDMLCNALPKKQQKKISRQSYRLSKLEVDFSTLNDSLISAFGFRLSEKDVFDKCTDISDFKQFVCDCIMATLDTVKDKPNFKLKAKSILLSQINELYKEFLYSAKTVELQRFNDSLAGNNSHNRVTELENIYNECNIDTLRKAIKKIFRPNLKENQSQNVSVTVESLTELPTISELIKRY